PCLPLFPYTALFRSRTTCVGSPVPSRSRPSPLAARRSRLPLQRSLKFRQPLRLDHLGGHRLDNHSPTQAHAQRAPCSDDDRWNRSEEHTSELQSREN